MDEFWETSFKEKGAMWGMDAAASAESAAQIFETEQYKEILIPGIGYGRNAVPFLRAGMAVTGIEISETAVGLLREKFGSAIRVFQGSVAQMPFEAKQYDGIFSFALLHLLSEAERLQFIRSCYELLKPGGKMIFTTIADTAPMFGTGKQITDRIYETRPGVRLFFYDQNSIQNEFRDAGLEETRLFTEPANTNLGAAALDFLWIECKKAN